MDENQAFSQQNVDQFTQMLTQGALGLGPNSGQALIQMQNDRALRQMQAQGAMGGALGVSQAQMAAPMLQSEMTAQAALRSSQDQLASQDMLGRTIDQTRAADLAQDEAAARWIQSSNEFNNLVSEQVAKGYQDASGAAVDQTKIALLIQNAIQERGRFLTNAEMRLVFAEAGYTDTSGETSIASDVAGPVLNIGVSLL